MNPVNLLKSLADETRLKTLLLILQEQECCVCELTCALDESQPKVSRHLARLRQDGVLQDRRAGQWVYYSLAPMPQWLLDALAGIAKEHQGFLTDSAERLANMGDRPQRQQQCCN
ncbi:metalloregulator ArsR/SmtB family transcription factor [Ferrimonas marina]|uniref:ArsR family transcriptional regulator n=1 Tax=Ferrimonas marina TaxID=299255 RepID=A0A1M5XDZ7_9GAMM|nr:metalloregulator ArsR/SmtB family transcription factor [Ferrimonas marina]SHH98006.1 ArsR family transcriptional regulator [Ferrimonas marina]